MRARGWVVAVVAALAVTPGVAPVWAQAKDPKPQPVDIKPFKDRLMVFQDGAGGTYVVLEPTGTGTRVWYGTGKILYEQIVTGRFRDGDAWDIATWAPRIADVHPGTIVRRKDATFHKSCYGADEAELTEITGDKAKALLAAKQLFTPALVRRPHLFARDDAGVYYYVDRLSDKFGGKGYRVFVGKKGAMKHLTLTDVASDTAGQVFSTKTGDLRLVKTVADPAKSTMWVKGGKRTELLPLDLDANSTIIFNELGIYKFTGTLCDNL